MASKIKRIEVLEYLDDSFEILKKESCKEEGSLLIKSLFEFRNYKVMKYIIEKNYFSIKEYIDQDGVYGINIDTHIPFICTVSPKIYEFIKNKESKSFTLGNEYCLFILAIREYNFDLALYLINKIEVDNNDLNKLVNNNNSFFSERTKEFMLNILSISIVI